MKHLNQEKLDANQQIYFARELEKVKAKSYDVLYPMLKARSVIPVSFEAGPGAETIKYEQYDSVGVAKIIANYAKDFVRVDIKGAEFRSPIKSLGDAYGWNVQEIRAAAFAGKPLEQRRANAAKRAIAQTENTIAFFGDAEYNLPGFFTNPNIPTAAVPADGTGASTFFSAKTPDQIIRDIGKLILDIQINTKMVEMANTVLFCPTTWSYLRRTRMGVGDGGLTIMQFLRENYPEITFDWLNELETAGVGSTRAMVAYDRNPDKLTLEIPSDFEQFAPEQDGQEFNIDCHERIGGTIVYYPLSVNFAYGV